MRDIQLSKGMNNPSSGNYTNNYHASQQSLGNIRGRRIPSPMSNHHHRYWTHKQKQQQQLPPENDELPRPPHIPQHHYTFKGGGGNNSVSTKSMTMSSADNTTTYHQLSSPIENNPNNNNNNNSSTTSTTKKAGWNAMTASSQKDLMELLHHRRRLRKSSPEEEANHNVPPQTTTTTTSSLVTTTVNSNHSSSTNTSHIHHPKSNSNYTVKSNQSSNVTSHSNNHIPSNRPRQSPPPPPPVPPQPDIPTSDVVQPVVVKKESSSSVKDRINALNKGVSKRNESIVQYWSHQSKTNVEEKQNNNNKSSSLQVQTQFGTDNVEEEEEVSPVKVAISMDDGEDDESPTKNFQSIIASWKNRQTIATPNVKDEKDPIIEVGQNPKEEQPLLFQDEIMSAKKKHQFSNWISPTQRNSSNQYHVHHPPKTSKQPNPTAFHSSSSQKNIEVESEQQQTDNKQSSAPVQPKKKTSNNNNQWKQQTTNNVNAGIKNTNNGQFSNLLRSWRSNLDQYDHNVATNKNQMNAAVTKDDTLTEKDLETNQEMLEERHSTETHDRSMKTATALEPSSTFQPKKRKEHFTFDIVHENNSNNSSGFQVEEELEESELNESFEISLQEQKETFDEPAKHVTSQTKEPEWIKQRKSLKPVRNRTSHHASQSKKEGPSHDFVLNDTRLDKSALDDGYQNNPDSYNTEKNKNQKNLNDRNNCHPNAQYIQKNSTPLDIQTNERRQEEQQSQKIKIPLSPAPQNFHQRSHSSSSTQFNQQREKQPQKLKIPLSPAPQHIRNISLSSLHGVQSNEQREEQPPKMKLSIIPAPQNIPKRSSSPGIQSLLKKFESGISRDVEFDDYKIPASSSQQLEECKNNIPNQQDLMKQEKTTFNSSKNVASSSIGKTHKNEMASYADSNDQSELTQLTNQLTKPHSSSSSLLPSRPPEKKKVINIENEFMNQASSKWNRLYAKSKQQNDEEVTDKNEKESIAPKQHESYNQNGIPRMSPSGKQYLQHSSNPSSVSSRIRSFHHSSNPSSVSSRIKSFEDRSNTTGTSNKWKKFSSPKDSSTSQSHNNRHDESASQSNNEARVASGNYNSEEGYVNNNNDPIKSPPRINNTSFASIDKNKKEGSFFDFSNFESNQSLQYHEKQETSQKTTHDVSYETKNAPDFKNPLHTKLDTSMITQQSKNNNTLSYSSSQQNNNTDNTSSSNEDVADSSQCEEHFFDYDEDDDECDGVTLSPSTSEISALTNPSCLDSSEDDGSQYSSSDEDTAGGKQSRSSVMGPSEASSSQTSEAATPLIHSTLGKLNNLRIPQTSSSETLLEVLEEESNNARQTNSMFQPMKTNIMTNDNDEDDVEEGLLLQESHIHAPYPKHNSHLQPPVGDSSEDCLQRMTDFFIQQSETDNLFPPTQKETFSNTFVGENDQLSKTINKSNNDLPAARQTNTFSSFRATTLSNTTSNENYASRDNVKKRSSKRLDFSCYQTKNNDISDTSRFTKRNESDHQYNFRHEIANRMFNRTHPDQQQKKSIPSSPTTSQKMSPITDNKKSSSDRLTSGINHLRRRRMSSSPKRYEDSATALFNNREHNEHIIQSNSYSTTKANASTTNSEVKKQSPTASQVTRTNPNNTLNSPRFHSKLHARYSQHRFQPKVIASSRPRPSPLTSKNLHHHHDLDSSKGRDDKATPRQSTSSNNDNRNVASSPIKSTIISSHRLLHHHHMMSRRSFPSQNNGTHNTQDVGGTYEKSRDTIVPALVSKKVENKEEKPSKLLPNSPYRNKIYQSIPSKSTKNMDGLQSKNNISTDPTKTSIPQQQRRRRLSASPPNRLRVALQQSQPSTTNATEKQQRSSPTSRERILRQWKKKSESQGQSLREGIARDFQKRRALVDRSERFQTSSTRFP